MHSVTNNSKAEQGIWTDTGVVGVGPGETKHIAIKADYLERAKSLPFLSIKDGDEVKAPESAEAGDIEAAIQLLDPANDDHWTNAGLPAVDAVKSLLGRDVSRADINQAAPEFMRPTE